jgi:predicted  nucleic acid-binding Zn-ribbon protein
VGVSDETEQIQVGNVSTADNGTGENVSLPVVQVLTGRGFVTGKSGSGKSNTASVVIEELLDAGYPVLIVDTDGEYYGLKEEYELLHAGADEECDIQVSPEHAEKLANLALEENVPIILDVSGYLDEDVADDLLRETARHLFAKEKKLKKPFLLVVEEVHEYLPQKGGGGETGKMLIKIGKRGRKHGLGLLGISQRPADVKKDFITQANWLVWHRLTWDNDTKVVGRVVDDEYEEAISELGDGEAFVQTDWTDTDVRRVQFRRKRTFDAGATPGLDDFERPELKSVSDSLMDDLVEITEEEEEFESELADLQQQLDKKRAKIKQLEQDLEKARDISDAARQLANAFRRNDIGSAPEQDSDSDQSERIEQLESRVETSEQCIEEREQRITELEEQRDELVAEREELLAERDELEEQRDALAMERDELAAEREQITAERDELREQLEAAEDRIESLEAETDRLREKVVDARQSQLSEPAGPEPTDAVTPDGGGTAVEQTVPVGTESSGDSLLDSNSGGPNPDEELLASLEDVGADEARPPNLAPDVGLEPSEQEPDPEFDDGELLESSDEPTIPTDLEERPPVELVRLDPVRSNIEAAIRESQCNEERSWRIVELLATEGPRRADELEPKIDTRIQHVWTLLAELRGYEFVERNPDGRYALDPERMRELIATADAVNEQFQEFKEHATQLQ